MKSIRGIMIEECHRLTLWGRSVVQGFYYLFFNKEKVEDSDANQGEMNSINERAMSSMAALHRFL